ncbi:MAG: nickel pincer cofactor biosynthesis protein LarC [Chloroflexi bacterium]|nr:nickel pincer cofactor biosynthesis protein LarC [Chloroflexota bacterium]
MIAYLDMPSGISGDMFLGCLIDAGWPLAALQATIEQMALPAGLWSVQADTVMRGALRATLVNVQAAEGDQHRHLSDVGQIIQAGQLPATVQNRAMAVFTRLAQAEASVHGTTVEEVHFHEVGALDAIIDIVGVCAGLHALGIEQLYASGVPLGEGWTMTAHGRVPLPAPATLNLLAAAQAPTRPAPGPGELVTPTGAALLAEFAIFTQPRMQLQRIGMGTGQKDFAWPNVARLWLGEAVDSGQLVQIETNIDDMNPELYAAVSQNLFAAGALDVWTTPIQMKKGRPGLLLSVLVAAAKETTLADLLLRETTTLGVRVHHVHRHIARREFATVQTTFGAVQVKLKWVNGELLGAKPEYEDCLRLANEYHVPVRQVYEATQAAAYAFIK